MMPDLHLRSSAEAEAHSALIPGSAQWLRLARIARVLSWSTLGWLGIEAGVAIGAAVIAGSVALLGFGLDSGIEALASIIVIWRFTGTRLASATSERRAQQLVAISFYMLAPYIAIEASLALASGDRAETTIVGIVLTAGTATLEPVLGFAKRRIGARLGSAATAGEGTQNLLCAYLAAAVFVGLLANTLFGAWWLDGVVALAIAGWALVEGRGAWAGRNCGCACVPDGGAGCDTERLTATARQPCFPIWEARQVVVPRLIEGDPEDETRPASLSSRARHRAGKGPDRRSELKPDRGL